MTDGRPVLVVEDDVDLRGMLEILLDGAGYDVRTASEGGEALRQVAERMPRLILLDMKMPGMDGWEFSRQFRGRHGRAARIVVMTAAEDARRRAEEIQADGYLEKPFDVDAVLAMLGRMTGGT